MQQRFWLDPIVPAPMRALLVGIIALLAIAIPVAADPVEQVLGFVEENTPSCDGGVDGEDGRTGAGCRLARNCYAVMWGYHSAFLTVGGGSSCSGDVWVDPSEDPEDPTEALDPLTGALCLNTADLC